MRILQHLNQILITGGVLFDQWKAKLVKQSTQSTRLMKLSVKPLIQILKVVSYVVVKL